ncbi:cupin domain-containing protein [Lysinibacillus sp. 54212]|uniref:cupin domain-containing protein n=1 Tax=Lysinibacillus sp. 54212 TaxID=3119829 RepID=UPI002FCB8F14
MYYTPWPYVYTYPNPYYMYIPTYNYGNQFDYGSVMAYPTQSQATMESNPIVLTDYGPKPLVINIEKATEQNNTFRTALWTGKYLQVTLMSIQPGEDIGLEIHPHLDQFVRIEQGQGIVRMGERKEDLDYVKKVNEDDAVLIPASTWHNLTNTGHIPLKLYSIYAPPQHPFGTVHNTKNDAIHEYHD